MSSTRLDEVSPKESHHQEGRPKRIILSLSGQGSVVALLMAFGWWATMTLGSHSLASQSDTLRPMGGPVYVAGCPVAGSTPGKGPADGVVGKKKGGGCPEGAYLIRSPRAVPEPGQASPHMGPKGTGRTKLLRDLPRVLPLRDRGDSAEKGVGEPNVIGIMLVEDHQAFRQTLAFLLAREPDLEVVAQAGTLAEAREALEGPISGGLDVALIDLGLPDGDGGELIGELRRRSPEVSVVVLSASIDQRRLEKVSRTGATAVLEKTHSPAAIAQEVRRLGEGG